MDIDKAIFPLRYGVVDSETCRQVLRHNCIRCIGFSVSNNLDVLY